MESSPRPDVPDSIKRATEEWRTRTDPSPTANKPWYDAARRLGIVREQLVPHRKLAYWQREPGAPDDGVEADEALLMNQRTPSMFTDLRMTEAMLIAGVGKGRWLDREQVRSSTDPMARLKRDPNQAAFAETLRIVCDNLLEEEGLTESIQREAIRDALVAPLVITKLTWYESWKDSLHDGKGKDDRQDNIARLVEMKQRVMDGTLTEADAEWQDMISLLVGLQEEGEVELWYGPRLRQVPFLDFRIDPAVRDLTRIYEAGWMADEWQATDREIATLFPWTGGVWDGKDKGGVHPDDLKGSQAATSSSLAWNKDKTQQGTPEYLTRWVRQVWIRSLGVVRTYIEGVDYPVQEIVPTRTPEDWYPYRFLTLHAVSGDLYQASPGELAAQLQDILNRKLSGLEKARGLAMGRTFYDQGAFDEEDRAALTNAAPGEMRGLKLPQGKTLGDCVFTTNVPLVPEAYDTRIDRSNISKALMTPEQLGGVTGRANYAKEVEAAMIGAETLQADAFALIATWKAGIYRATAQMALQELSPMVVRQIAGANAFWPEFQSDAAAQATVRTIRKQAKAAVMVRLLPDFIALQQQGAGSPQALDEMEKLGQAERQLEEQRLMRMRFGADEPLTRESLFRRLCVVVAIDKPGRIAKTQQLEALDSLSDILSKNGILIDLTPVVDRIGKLLDCNEDLGEMVKPTLERCVALLARAIPPNAPPEVIQAVQVLMGAIAPQQPQGA